MIQRGDATTRERVFADVLLLVRRHDIDGATFIAAITATAAHRETRVRPLGEILVTLGRDRQSSWTAFLDRSGLAGTVAAAYGEVISEVIRFTDPVLRGEAGQLRWSALSAAWEEPTRR